MSITPKMTSHAALGTVLRPGASTPAMAMAISRCAMSVSMITDPCRHGCAATSRAALTAATTSMKAASRSKIQVGIMAQAPFPHPRIGPTRPRCWLTPL